MDNISIHPGVQGGRRHFPLGKSTQPFKNKGKLAKKMKILARRRLAHAATLRVFRRMCRQRPTRCRGV